MSEPSDSHALLTRVAQGDEEAMQHLYQRYRTRLWRYVWQQLGGNTPLAEETLQDIFLAIWTSARQFRGEAQVTTWIYQIAHHRVIDAARRQTRHAGIAPTDDQQLAEQASQGEYWEDTVIDRLLLGDSFQHLAPKHREVLELVFVQGFNLDEVARILSIPTGTVKSRLRAARLTLLKRYHLSTGSTSHA